MIVIKKHRKKGGGKRQKAKPSPSKGTYFPEQ